MIQGLPVRSSSCITVLSTISLSGGDQKEGREKERGLKEAPEASPFWKSRMKRPLYRQMYLGERISATRSRKRDSEAIL